MRKMSEASYLEKRMIEVINLHKKLGKENKFLTEGKIVEIVQMALRAWFIEKKSFYLHDHFLKVDLELSLLDNCKRIEREITNVFGDERNYRLHYKYEWLKNWLWFNAAKYYPSKSQIRHAHYSGQGLTSFFAPLYVFVELLLNGTDLPDHSIPNRLLEENKPLAYQPAGVFICDLMTIKWFKNGRVDLTFYEAKEFFDKLRAFEALKFAV